MGKVYFRWAILLRMTKKETHIFHWILLGAIPILLLLGMLKKSTTFDIQLYDTYYIVTAFHFSLALSLGVSIKAILYYLTRGYPFSKALCYLDVMLTILICFVIYYVHNKPADGFESFSSIQLQLTLLIVFWVLIQLFVFINFFVHLLMRTDKSVGGKDLE